MDMMIPEGLYADTSPHQAEVSNLRNVTMNRLDAKRTNRFVVQPVIEEHVPKPRTEEEEKESEIVPPRSQTPPDEEQPLLNDNNNDVFEDKTKLDTKDSGSSPATLKRTLSLNIRDRYDSTNNSVTVATTSTCREILETKELKSMKQAGENYGRSKQSTKERLVDKAGNINLAHVNFQSKGKNFFIDIFTTLVDMKWRYNVLMFAMGFLVTWFAFAIVWYVILIIHQDHLHVDDPDWTPCMAEVYDFWTAFLFSLETQHTIGYGSRSIHPRCPPAIMTLMVQSCTGVFVQSLMTGVIFAKLARPKRRSHTIIFSQDAVICLRDNVYCLLFRVGDMRSSSLIINATVRAILFKNRTTQEAEDIPLCQYPVAVETETSLVDTYAFMVTPVTVMHKIDKDSPFWGYSQVDLYKEKFEIVVIMEGTIESTGMATQLRSSFIPTEIIWGNMLEPLVTCKKGKGYEIDYQMFHKTRVQEGMPTVSAQEYEEHGRSDDAGPIPSKLVNFTLPTRLNTPPVSKTSTKLRRVFSMMMSRNRSHSSPTAERAADVTTVHDMNGDVKNNDSFSKLI